MKFTRDAFDLVVNAPQYEGAEAYLIDDEKNMVKYQIYVCVVESGNVAAIICEKMPATKQSENFEVYEFNGNKLLEHNVVRLRLLDKDNERAKGLVQKFVDKKLFYNK